MLPLSDGKSLGHDVTALIVCASMTNLDVIILIGSLASRSNINTMRLGKVLEFLELMAAIEMTALLCSKIFRTMERWMV